MTELHSDNTEHGHDLPCVLRDFVLRNRADAMCIIKDFAVVEMNDRCFELLGYKDNSEIFGTSILQIIAPEQTLIAIQRNQQRMMGNPVSTSYVYTCFKNDGDSIRVEASAIPWPADPSIAIIIARDVTQREQGIETLKESEKLYRTLAENLPAGIMLEDKNSRRIYVNSTAANLSGYTVEEILAGAVLTHPDELETNNLYARAVSEGIGGRAHETRFVRKDGSIMPVSVSWQPLRNGKGEHQGLHTIFVDISEHKRIESALRDTEGKYKIIVESSPDLIWQMNDQGVFTFMSPACRRYGYEPEEMIGRPSFDFLADSAKDYIISQFPNDFASAAPIRYEVPIIKKDGDIAWIEIMGNFIIAGGRPVAVQGIARDITDRRQAEQAVRESEERYRGLVESQHDLILRCTPDGIITFVNDAYCRMFGKTREELIGSSFMPLVHEDDIPITIAAMERLKLPPYRISIEQRARTVHGWRWFSWEDYSIQYKSGQIAEIQAIGRDITAGKEVEQALRESEQKYRTLVEQAADGIFVADMDGRYSDVNPSGCSLLGYSLDELLKMRIYDIIREEDIPKQDAEAARIQAGENVISEWLLKRKDGTLAAVELSAHMLGSDKMQAIVRDITERKRVEEALRKSESNNKALLEAIPDLMFRIKGDGTFIDCKESKDVPLYLPAADFTGNNIADVMPGDISSQLLNLCKRALETNQTQFYEYQLPMNDGIYYFEDRTVKTGDDEVLSIIRDITFRKNAEEDLRRAHEDLEKAYELQREFLNNVTHEVRTPLTAVQGYVKMLLEGMVGPVTNEQAHLLQRVLSSSEHLLEIVDAVLEIARLKSGRMMLRPRACQPGEVVDKAIAQVTPQAAAKGLSINVTGINGKCMGVYDEEKLTRVLTNLLANAVKFTQAGSIDVIVDSSPEGVEVIVSDTGLGISSEKLECIFDEFQQFDFPQKHKPSGFGIGLAIVENMVDTIGATLIVSSKNGLGTAFTLHVPVLRDW